MNQITKLTILLSILIVGLSSCSKDVTEEIQTDRNSQEEIKKSGEIDKTTEAMDEIMHKVYEKQEEGEILGLPVDYNSMPECVTVTVVYELNFREITIDFGAEGCEVGENILKGKMILAYERNPGEQQVFITKSLEDFYFNDKNIIGSKTILKEHENENGNPQFTHTLDLEIIWSSGLTAFREGLKIKEWVEGFESSIYSDNVFEITGNWTSVFVSGNIYQYSITSPLRREASCSYFVNGTVEVVKPIVSGTLDYGDGGCDNLAIFTNQDGDEIEIILD